jgi:hypothetical protein
VLTAQDRAGCGNQLDCWFSHTVRPSNQADSAGKAQRIISQSRGEMILTGIRSATAKMEMKVTNSSIRKQRLRRTCKTLGFMLVKSRRRRGSEHGPYHFLEPVRHLALSAGHYPNGMTLQEAECFIGLPCEETDLIEIT